MKGIQPRISQTMKVLDDAGINRIHQATLEVLETVGVLFEHQEACSIFRDAGATVDGFLVKLPSGLVERTIETAPCPVTLYARNPEQNVELGQGRVHYTNAFGATWVYDLDDGNPRPATFRDLQDFTRVADYLDNVHYVIAQVQPQDVPNHLMDVYTAYAMFTNTSKHVIPGAATEAQFDVNLELGRIASQGNPCGEVPIFQIGGCSVSPLKYPPQVSSQIIKAAGRNIHCGICNGAMAGGTSPVTLAGTLVVQNAELLAGFALAQLVRPGLPCIYSTFACSMDMGTGKSVLAGPELALMNAATQQLCDFYNLPFGYGTGGHADSPVSGLQAGVEKSSTTLFAALAGVDVIHDGASGLLGGGMLTSFQQLIADDEMCNMINRLMDGIQVDDDTLAVDVIRQVGPGGDFLTTDHTLDHFRREHYLPQVLDRDPASTVFEGTHEDILARSKRKAERILESHRPQRLVPEQEEAMRKIVRDLDPEAFDRLGL